MWKNDTPTAESACCLPSGSTCFFCCPPIRSTRHDTLFLREKWHKRLRENTLLLSKRISCPVSIDGRWCWALGYLDDTENRVGCLLHPERHNGLDMRHLVGMGQKCARESCRESTVYLSLGRKEREFCRGLALDGDSFIFSSRLVNPLFRLLGWGAELVSMVSATCTSLSLSREETISRFWYILFGLDPGKNAYWLRKVVESAGWKKLQGDGIYDFLHFRRSLEGYLIERFGHRRAKDNHLGPMVHLHRGLDQDMARWLKFGASIWRTSENELIEILNICIDYFNAYW